jgi:hypothetical protein
MNKKPEKRYKNNYRFSDEFIKVWTRILVTVLCVGLGGAAILLIYLLIAYGDVPTDELPVWATPAMLILGGGGLVIPLVAGAILGGLAIHKYAWIPLLFVVGGLLAIGASAVDGLEFLAPYAIASMIIGGIAVFVIALGFTKVPVWLQLPILRSPRLNIRDNKTKKKK